ncbi:hypothetical protein [Vibrio phage vB_VpM-pA2SJ1]|uniref:Uncharacterized protein n=1 Tax=Vibrio phage vB_VpM-pA2SJ1 TaxID=3095964 RepID=A0AAX4J5U7_9CAUD
MYVERNGALVPMINSPDLTSENDLVFNFLKPETGIIY